MKVTGKRVIENTYHISTEEMYNNYNASLKDMIWSGGIETTTIASAFAVMVTISLESYVDIRQLFRDGFAVQMMGRDFNPKVGDYFQVKVTCRDGSHFIILFEDIDF